MYNICWAVLAFDFETGSSHYTDLTILGLIEGLIEER
jgi:hypothetical protein